MKTFHLRSILWGTNIGGGILILFLITGGIELFGNSSIHWLDAVYIGGGAVLIMAAINLILFSSWVIPSLRASVLLARSYGKDDLPPSSPARIRELSELNQRLCAHVRRSQDLNRIGDEFLHSGERQEINFPSQGGTLLEETFLRYINVLDAVDSYIHEITEGHLFFEIPEILRQTRVGVSLQGMTTELQMIIRGSREGTQNISRASATIAGMAQQGARNADTETREIENISSASHQVAANLREVTKNLKRQSDSLTKTFADIQDMRDSTEQINSSVELLSTSAEATSQSIGEIHEFMQEIDGHAHSLAEISDTISTEAKNGGQAVEEVIEGIQTINDTVEDAATAIRRLGDASERIGEILEVINGIAEQTNLLALNASIIAAQAGEHGRGFAVVAEEIKELAERTRISTNEIEAIIKSLQGEVEDGSIAMKRCLKAVHQGVDLANRSGQILERIVLSIQGAQEMASMLAQATVTQTQNSQQVHSATGQVIQKIEELTIIASKQAKDSTHLAEMATILKEVTQHIDQAAIIQLQGTDSIVASLEELQNLVRGNAEISYQLASSSHNLGELGSNLAENIGHFLMAPLPLPANFDPGSPTVAFIYPGAPSFFNDVYSGIYSLSSEKHYQSITLDSQNDIVLQAEYINRLVRQPWLNGMILTPSDDQTGFRVVSVVMQHKIPLVVLDRPTQNAMISVVSDNQQGGELAADMLRESSPQKGTIFVCGPRNVEALFSRMEGFFKKAAAYHWHVVEIFTTFMDITLIKQAILRALNQNPDARGIFLTNEQASLAYLELHREGKIPQEHLYAVAYDLNVDVAEAIADKRLLGTIFQDPAQLGRIAMQELWGLLQQSDLKTSTKPKKILVPVRAITEKNLSSEWLHRKSLVNT